MDRSDRLERQLMRRRDPQALATILIGQLMAYRASTVYAPSTAKLDQFLAEEVFPRLEQQLDVRKVVVDAWEKPGPTLEQLVDALYSQLDIEPVGVPKKPSAALENVLLRAQRRSDRPLLIVLYKLEGLLNESLPPADALRFVEALSRMATRSMHGLQLILGVKEEQLGAFRELLRGHWRLLANDIRIRPKGEKWILPLPVGGVTSVATSAAGAVVAGGKAVIATLAGLGGLGAGVLVGASLLTGNGDLETCREQLAAAQQQTCPECPEPPEIQIPVEPPLPVTTGEPESTGDVETDSDTTTLELVGDETTGDLETDPQITQNVGLCSAGPRDNDCAKCVKQECCSQLRACKRRRWRNCVLKKRIGEGSCQPAAIEKRCRGLALCALEYQCRASCFEN